LLLEEFGVEVEMRRLDVGDYIRGPETVVERETVHDLHLTIINGRLWRQLGQLRTTGGSPCLMIEGRNLYSGRFSSGTGHSERSHQPTHQPGSTCAESDRDGQPHSSR
jgi:ERCC4-type nuclease